MKKLLLSGFLGICTLLNAQFNIGFETSEGYTVGNTLPSGWLTFIAGDQTRAITADKAKTGTQSLVVTPGTNQGIGGPMTPAYNPNGQTVFTVSADFYLTGDVGDSWFQMQPLDRIDTSYYYAMQQIWLAPNSNNSIAYIDNDGNWAYSADNVYTKNAWHNLKYVIDYNTDTFKIYIDNNLVATAGNYYWGNNWEVNNVAFRTDNWDGLGKIYWDNVRINYDDTVCPGTPNAGNALTNLASVCPASSFTLSCDAVTKTGYTYQWQSSTDGNNWNNLGSSQTNSSYTVSSQNVTTSYRVIVTCTNSSASATSNPVTVTQNAPEQCTPADLAEGTGFETSEGYATGNIIGQKGWKAISLSDATSLVTTDRAKSGTQSLSMKPGTSQANTILISPTYDGAGAKVFTVSADFYITGDTATSRFAMIPTDLQGSTYYYTMQQVWLAPNENNSIRNIDNGNWVNSAGNVYTKNAWHNLKYVMDYNANTFKIYINNNLVVTAVNYYTSTEVDHLSFQTNNYDGLGKIYWDNVKISTKKPIIT